MARMNCKNLKFYLVRADKTIVKLRCLKTFEFGDDSTEREEVSCLDDPHKVYENGDVDPGQGSMEIHEDEENETHLLLFQLSESDEKCELVVVTSTASTELTESNGKLEFPADATCWHTANVDFEANTPKFEKGQKIKNVIKFNRSPVTRIARTDFN